MINANIYATDNGRFFVTGKKDNRRTVEIDVKDPDKIELCKQVANWIEGEPDVEIKELEEQVQQAQEQAAASAKQLREVLSIFPEWQTNQWLQPGEYRHYEGTIYKYAGKEYYKTKATETPDISPSLYVKASPETYDVKPITDYQDGKIYDAGDRVMFTDGRVYVSTADGNQWPPSVATAPWEIVK